LEFLRFGWAMAYFLTAKLAAARGDGKKIFPWPQLPF
jgi:hypothetical protein